MQPFICDRCSYALYPKNLPNENEIKSLCCDNKVHTLCLTKLKDYHCGTCDIPISEDRESSPQDLTKQDQFRNYSVETSMRYDEYLSGGNTNPEEFASEDESIESYAEYEIISDDEGEIFPEEIDVSSGSEEELYTSETDILEESEDDSLLLKVVNGPKWRQKKSNKTIN